MPKYRITADAELSSRRVPIDPKDLNPDSKDNPYLVTVGKEPIEMPVIIRRRNLFLRTKKTKKVRLATQKELEVLYKKGMTTLVELVEEEAPKTPAKAATGGNS